MDTLLQDFRYGLKSLWRTPRLTLAALACVAIGIGATLSAFTLLDAALVRQLPFPSPERLARVWTYLGKDSPRGDLSYPDFQDIKGQARSFDTLECAARTRIVVVYDTGSERTRGESVSPGYFSLLGIRPALGRLFAGGEYAANAPRVILLGDSLWRGRFGGRRDIVGSIVRVRDFASDNSAASLLFTVVGVMPPGFIGTVEDDVSEFWLPMAHYLPPSDLIQRGRRYIWTLGRLRPGVSAAAAQQEVAAIGATLARSFPATDAKLDFRIERFADNWRKKLRTGLYLLIAAASLLLLIACINIANLLLARLAGRRQELSLRLVMGARRSRVLRQLLTESLTLAALGGVIGMLLAYWGIRGFMAAVSFKVPSYVSIGADWRLAVATAGLVVATGIAFGVLPAWFGTQNAGAHLREAGRGATETVRQRAFGRALVICEVALTFVLLSAASLMLRSYLNLMRADLGYRTNNLLRMSVTLDLSQFPAPVDWHNLIAAAKLRLGSFPGVQRVSAVAGELPPWPDRERDIIYPGLPGGQSVHVGAHQVDADFFDALQIHLLHGRGIRTSDRSGGQLVAVVGKSLAGLIAGSRADQALGMRFSFFRPDTGRVGSTFEIVGVASDVKFRGPRGGRSNDYDLYVPVEQVPGDIVSFAVATSVEPKTLIAPLQKEIGALAPTSPVHWVGTMADEVGLQYADSRFYALLIVAYSACAALLAIIGIYSTLANAVSRRFRELGVRLALGASSSAILGMVLLQGLMTVLAGIAAGFLASAAGTRVMSSLLYGVSAADPLIYVEVAAGLLAVSLLACYAPARRATRVDPVAALRQE
jgi:putative ABC transport system permease protein